MLLFITKKTQTKKHPLNQKPTKPKSISRKALSLPCTGKCNLDFVQLCLVVKGHEVHIFLGSVTDVAILLAGVGIHNP